jgi:phosphoenolpyruvate-protein phosphotransferase/dihydroxyacetone kinase phosphotransfer subunit
MVGIVLVSHSRALALSVQELVRSMTGPKLPLAIAAGAGENHEELGTDAVEIAEAIVAVRGEEGVLVLMDMGSAILSSETALDLLDEPLRANIRFCAAPFVEGAVASGVTANLGASLDEVCAEAIASLKQKQVALNANQPADAKAQPSEKKPDATAPAKPGETIRLTVRNAHGLHARPAARLIAETRRFRSDITVRNLSNQRGPVSIRSLSSLAGLEILQDNEIEVTATGDDASDALKEIAGLVENGLGDPLPLATDVAAPRPKAKPAAQPRNVSSGPVPVSSGIAFGPGIYLEAVKLEIPQEKADNVAGEIDRLQTAVAMVQKALANRQEQMTVTAGAKNAEIYEAQNLALQDPELIESAVRMIKDEQANAALAWDKANQQIVSRYESLRDPYLRERAIDLEDVGRQVLELLVAKTSSAPMSTEPGILIADNLTPNQVSTLDRKLVLGVILLNGGPTAHSSILLKALGIPAVVQAQPVFADLEVSRPSTVAFDGSTGKIWLNPEPGFVTQLEIQQVEEQKQREEELEASALPAATLDGHAVEIFANIGSVSEVEAALHSGAEGVGLLRTEFLFLERESAPTEEEQMLALLAIAEKMDGKPLIVRTLDVGGDKPLPYLQMPVEENPFLGVRAIRLCFTHDELFATQLRAILRAGHGRDLRIMFPMIASTSDLDHATECLKKVHRDLEQKNVPHLWPVKTGIMIEIPSAAIQAESMARQADFFSIGTNDLTQYTLAADRGNPELASYQDALHPAVLRLIEMVVYGARQHDCLVAVCGEAASDERAASVFVGLGVQELSLTSAKIPHIKACLRKQSLASLQKLAHSALHCHTAAEVRALTPSG